MEMSWCQEPVKHPREYALAGGHCRFQCSTSAASRPLEISELHVVDIALGALRTCSEHHAGLGFASKSEIESSETAL